VDADVDIILSDVDGLYTANPQTNKKAKLIHEVEEITPEIEAMAGGAGSAGGTGGMYTKMQAAVAAVSTGINLVIASGDEPHVISRVLDGEELGTFFVSKENRLQFRKRWLAFGARIVGTLTVDEGLAKAVKRKGSCSILPVGMTKVEGVFDTGATVSVVDKEGHELARGIVNYPSDDLQKIIGAKTTAIAKILGHKHFDEVIHRDNLVVL